MTITLPLPPRALHAHTTGHWWAKSAPTKKARKEAANIASAYRRQRIEGRAVVSYDFYWPDRRRRDNANAIQSCKAYMDGIVDTGIIEGDHWEVLELGHGRSHVDKVNPRVEITLRPHAG
jgi:hypothetical protein